MNVGSLLRKNWEVLRFGIKDHLGMYKKWYILLIIVLLLAVTIGIVTGFSMKEVSISKIPEKVYQNYILGKLNVTKLFFSRFFDIASLAMVVYISCFKRRLSIFGMGLLTYKAFTLGITISYLIQLYHIAGVINVLLVVLPCYVLSLLFLGVWFILCMRHCFTSSIYGGSVFSREFWCLHKSSSIFLLTGILLLLVLEVVLLPLLSSTLIVVKS